MFCHCVPYSAHQIINFYNTWKQTHLFFPRNYALSLHGSNSTVLSGEHLTYRLMRCQVRLSRWSWLSTSLALLWNPNQQSVVVRLLCFAVILLTISSLGKTRLLESVHSMQYPALAWHATSIRSDEWSAFLWNCQMALLKRRSKPRFLMVVRLFEQQGHVFRALHCTPLSTLREKRNWNSKKRSVDSLLADAIQFEACTSHHSYGRATIAAPVFSFIACNSMRCSGIRFWAYILEGMHEFWSRMPSA